MKISSINFETWCKNHTKDHEAKWCRELYPWETFQRLDYDPSMLNIPQEIVIANLQYSATIQERRIAENGRINYLIRLYNTPSSKTQQWTQRSWVDVFHLVTDPSGYFITLFTKKQDPSKLLLRKFLNSKLADIASVRSLPISGLLFRSLISYAAYDTYEDLQRYKSFPILLSSRNDENNPMTFLRPGNYEPFLSQDRRLWISYSFTEEKAHRYALRFVGQAEKLIVVFCHPTFSRHHRCSEPSVSIVSLFDFLSMSSPKIHGRYIQQARFLLNHLREDQDETELSLTSATIVELIKTKQPPMPIETSDLREAKAGLGRVVNTTWDFAYVCACANLINAVMNKHLKCYKGSLNLVKEVYSFKAIFGQMIENIIWHHPNDVRIYVEPRNLVYISVCGLQFSFHSMPRTPEISAYEKSEQNIPQEWSGLKLQPVAPLVLKWARAILREENSKKQ